MRLRLLLIYLFIPTFAISQISSKVGIGTDTPKSSLDINSSSHGFIPPRVALENVFDSITVQNKFNTQVTVPDGTFVYNTTTNLSTISNSYTRLIPGLYVWKNKRWRRVLNGTTKVVADENGQNGPRFDTDTCSDWVETLSNLGNNNSVVDKKSIKEIHFDFNRLENSICQVELFVHLESRDMRNIELFLISPSGQILELMHGNGPIISGGDRKLNGSFSDQATHLITAWSNGNYNNMNFTPQGIMSVPNYENHYTSGNIPNLAGFIGHNPQGKWHFIINNQSSADNVNVLGIKLKLKVKEHYTIDSNYKLISQIQYNTKVTNKGVYNSSFNALVQSNVLHTVVTRSLTPIDPYLTPNSLSALEIRDVRTTMNNGQSWLQLNNQDIDTNMNLNTTYYYQLWYRGDILGNNKQHSVTINGYSD